MEVDLSLELPEIPESELPTVGNVKEYERRCYCGFLITRYKYRKKDRFMIDVFDTSQKMVLPVARSSKVQSFALCERLIRVVLMARRINYGVSPLLSREED